VLILSINISTEPTTKKQEQGNKETGLTQGWDRHTDNSKCSHYILHNHITKITITVNFLYTFSHCVLYVHVRKLHSQSFV